MTQPEPNDPIEADDLPTLKSANSDPAEPDESRQDQDAHPTLPTRVTRDDLDQTRQLGSPPIDNSVADRAMETVSDGPPETAETINSTVDSGPENQDPQTVAPTDRFVGMISNEESMATLASVDSRSKKDESAKLKIRQFGDYELLEKIAQGGMGVVFKARQVSLNRMIALKMILAGQLASTEDVLRFKVEAEATANLVHPGIVPIYEIGELDGQHFFSMGLINGESLSQKVADGPLQTREAAELTKQIAEAIAYAHEQGVIHRDLKPANILIDENGQPKVTDFGLAKRVEGGSNLTYTGQILGTPSYMPPEQAAGETSEIGPSADIYSLGAILYQLMTGRPPFQSANVMDILKQVMEQEPVAPRQLNAGISRDLETICLKCLEKKPAARYESAMALVEELNRYLIGEPIKARSIGMVGRLTRWCVRNPGIALLSATSLVFLIAALIATSVGYVRVKAAQQRSEEGFRHARQTVNEFLTRVADETLLNQPGMQPLKEDLLRRALKYYQSFLSDRGNDPEIVDELAGTYFRVALITEQIGSPEEALTAYQKARALLVEQLKASANVDETQDQLGTIWNAQGRVFSRLSKLEEARAAYVKAKEIRAMLADSNSKNRDYKRKLANTVMNIGLNDKAIALANRDKEKLMEAHEQMSAAQELRKELITADDQDFVVLRDLGLGHYNLGNIDNLRRDSDGALKHFTNAVTVFERLRSENPGNLDDNYQLAVCRRLLADSHADVEAAAKEYAAARQEIQELATRNPQVTDYQLEHARVLMNLGMLQIDEFDLNEGLSTLHSASQILQRLITSSEEAKRDLAIVLQTVGDIERQEGREKSGREKLIRARKLLVELLEQSKGNRELQSLLEETEQLLND